MTFVLEILLWLKRETQEQGWEGTVRFRSEQRLLLSQGAHEREG